MKSGVQYGYYEPVINDEDFIFGDGKLGDAPINPGGHWARYLPPIEDQDSNGFETYCCVTEATLNCIETLINFEYGMTTNFSDRFLATVSGTGHFKGNNPGTVAETLRVKGCPHETAWSFKAPDFNTFYTDPPKEIKTLAIATFAEYDYGHSWVKNPTPESMKAALEYSPLSLGVAAWYQNADNRFYRPTGIDSNHCIEVYDYVDGQEWWVFDSYANEHKKLEWDFTFSTGKRHTIHRQTATTTQAQSAWRRFLSFFGL